MNKAEEDIRVYKKAIEIDPNDSEAYFNLGTIYEKKGLIKESIEAYKNSAKHIENYGCNNWTDVYFKLGTAYEKKGQLKKAVNAYKKNPLDIFGEHNSSCTEDSCEFDKHRNYLADVFNLSTECIQQGLLEDAKSIISFFLYEIDRSFNFNIDDLYAEGNTGDYDSLHSVPDAYYYLGVINEKQGNIKEAIGDYKTVLVFNVNHDKARSNLERLYKEQK